MNRRDDPGAADRGEFGSDVADMAVDRPVGDVGASAVIARALSPNMTVRPWRSRLISPATRAAWRLSSAAPLPLRFNIALTLAMSSRGLKGLVT
ncbi:hypothetical protein IE4803_PD00654 (plasmid) [Rhizobium etli bv. phaseoli str. IE4803]|nr:hypothetical protein IE4803_PD00654 [Rhizobium etli bv. phaseoli str. IE4803]